MPRQFTFSLSQPRAEQLRRIARCEGLTIGALLENFIVNEWKRLKLDSYGPPGFYVQAAVTEGNPRRRARRCVFFSIREVCWVELEPDQADSLAIGLIKAADAGEAFEFVASRYQLRVVRRGRGLILSAIKRGEEQEKEKTVPFNIVRDVAEALTREAGKVRETGLLIGD